jgi:SulP family sulfate permease
VSRATVAEPLAARWRRYRGDALADDFVAALIVTILLLPQSLAYAMLAGLPPVVGVMASLLPLLVYAALGSSSTLAVGPVAVLAMMTAQVVVPAAAAHGVPVHQAALVLALLIGLVLALAALLRLEVFAALLGAPVLHGFITGAALVIALGQVPALLGLAVHGHTALELAQSAWAAPSLLPHAATAAVGLAALLALWALRRWAQRAGTALGLPPRPALLLARSAPMWVVVAAVVWVLHAGAAAEGVALTGSIDLAQGLAFAPPWTAPAALWLALLPAAALLGLVAYVESLAVAEALAVRRGEKIDARRELVALAGANLAAGAGGGMPVTGGFARSIVNFDAGARTRLAGVWTALLLAVAVWALGDWLGLLPKAVLAATIVVAVLSLLEARPFVEAWRWSRPEFALMAAVAALTVLLGVEVALAAGVVLSAGLLLQRTARPHWAEVGRIPGTEVFRNVRRFEVETLPDVLALRVDESLLFTNSRWLAETLGALPARRPGLRHFVLMMSGVNDIDYTGLKALQQLAQELRAQGVSLHLAEIKSPVGDRLRAHALHDWLGDGRVFRTAHDAFVALARQRLAGGNPAA